MIPKPIADQLRSGETPLNTCREFDNVSVLFSDIVSFTPMCSRLRPMEVVCVLNAMCVAFDQLCDKHGVYKVVCVCVCMCVCVGGGGGGVHMYACELLTSCARHVVPVYMSVRVCAGGDDW